MSGPAAEGRPAEVSDIALTGGFVAWKRYTVDESLGRSEHALLLLDLKSGVSQTVAAIIGPADVHPSSSLADFVLNDKGTLVWLVNSASCGNPCDVTSKLSESRIGEPNSVLEKDSNTGPPGGPAPNPPIGSVGVSRFGRVAYWMANGKARSHDIP